MTLGEAETQVLDYVKQHVPGGEVGAAVRQLDRHRPRLPRPRHAALDAHLHYRMIDVSSIKELAKRWYPRVYQSQPAKGLPHRALADIHESVQELAYYRRTLFVEPPGRLGKRPRRSLRNGL